MEKDNNNSLILRPSTDIAKPSGGTNRVIARMNQDVLDRANARFRIGEYLLREPDYNQVRLWADSMEMSPERTLQLMSEAVSDDGKQSFLVEQGSIVSLVWDFEHLLLLPNSWLAGLRIRALCFRGHAPESSEALAVSLVRLCSLYIVNSQITELDLSRVPELTWLDCYENQLTTLDLSRVPKLTWLSCVYNQLTTFDLSGVPRLSELYCHSNQLTTLDLTEVPELTKLWCDQNQLTTLDLSEVPKLTALICGDNQLTTLDLSEVPVLTNLKCYENELTTLDLSEVPKLIWLSCENNQLTTLDLSRVPKLTELICDRGVKVLNAPEGLRISYE